MVAAKDVGRREIGGFAAAERGVVRDGGVSWAPSEVDRKGGGGDDRMNLSEDVLRRPGQKVGVRSVDCYV